MIFFKVIFDWKTIKFDNDNN